MAMLAGPRKKQKVINLRAKNNTWSNDSNKFGQKMLEKMGWKSGKGLGANENGIVEHVIAKYKNDEKGFGFEDRNDQWMKTEDDFNSLLANLSNGSSSELKLHSGISLEEKSKKSKARVHYHKFTRGKDLSQYSEKDLANIFGKKRLRINSENVTEIENVAAKEETLKTEQIFKDSGSMEDYFKNKMNSLKTSFVNKQDSTNDQMEEFEFQGFAGTVSNTENTKHTNTNFYSYFSSFEKQSTDSNEFSESSKGTVKKYKKNNNMVVDKGQYEESSSLNINSSNTKELCENVIKTKKNKHQKSLKSLQGEDMIQNPQENVVAIQKSSKSYTEEFGFQGFAGTVRIINESEHSNSYNGSIVSLNTGSVGSSQASENKVRKSKKNKNKRLSVDLNLCQNVHEDTSIEQKSFEKSIKKKIKIKDKTSQSGAQDSEVIENLHDEKFKRNHRSQKLLLSSDKDEIISVRQVLNIKKSKKKQKSESLQNSEKLENLIEANENNCKKEKVKLNSASKKRINCISFAGKDQDTIKIKKKKNKLMCSDQ